MIAHALEASAAAEVDTAAIAADCYACPGCGRDPVVHVGHDGSHTSLACGIHDCPLPSPLTATGNTPAEAAEVWNRRALDLGDALADAVEPPRPPRAPVLVLPTTPRAKAAHRALRAVVDPVLSDEEVLWVVDMLEAAGGEERLIITMLTWAGVDPLDANHVGAGLGYLQGPLVTCWSCRRPLSPREPKTLEARESRACWGCRDCGGAS